MRDRQDPTEKDGASMVQWSTQTWRTEGGVVFEAGYRTHGWIESILNLWSSLTEHYSVYITTNLPVALPKRFI